VEYGSLFNLGTLKFLLTLGIAGVQSYMYCSLFQRVNDSVLYFELIIYVCVFNMKLYFCFKIEGVNFGLYCCDWTGMNIHMKKLILFTMRMNSSNKLKMNITTNKSINLPLLSTVCFNIRHNYNKYNVISQITGKS